MKPIVKLILIVVLVLGLGWYILGPEVETGNDQVLPVNISEEGIKIVAFGDSLTAGYGVDLSDAYPAQLEVALKNLGYKVTVINSGVSGETTRGNLERAEFIRAQNPVMVILGIGGNDALRGLPVAETKKNLLETIDILKSGEEPPVLILLKMQAPLNSGFAYKQDFDRIYEEVAEAEDVILVPFLTTELFFDSSNKLGDCIHYNRQAYEMAVKQHVLPAVLQVLSANE